MVTSLSDFCARLNASTSLVVQADRRQVDDRRRTRRGGRRADDASPALDQLDMRSVAIRRAVIGSHLTAMSSVDEDSHADARYAIVSRPAAPAERGLASAAGRRTLE